MNFLTPAEIAVSACNAGKAKTEMPIFKMIVLGILAGAYIGFGANLATKIGATPDADTAIGVFLFGAVFSVGLMLVVIAGAELFTGNNMACMLSVINGQSTWGGLLKNWVVVWISNFAGSLLLVFIIFYGMYWVATDPVTGAVGLSAMGAKAVGIATGKLSLTWSSAFLRGICCNWLVCLAVWMAFAAKDIVGKIFGIFFPIMAFVSSGFEHSVANMFFIPMGMKVANAAPAAAAANVGMAPEAISSFYSYGHLMTANLIPVTLGNIVGGAIFVGCFYWIAYIRK
ncbi:MAG TPA: formate/nitrite transporter family protein [Syntrophomonadaceae bacterium]|nr:formate/nitrite transporter family protein [Syntrophomonadaceae bacterium]